MSQSPRNETATSILRALCAAAALGFGCSIPSAVAPSLSGSVGVPHAGFLTDARELPREGKGYRWASTAHHHHGLPRLVRLIEFAAARVADARPSTPPLFVAEISARGGGTLIPKHRSHRTGRDADLLFYVTTLEGVPINGTSFTKFGPDGLGVDPSGRWVRFDVHRNWLLAKSLIENDIAHLQWLFVSSVLEAILIEHALALGESSALIQKAQSLFQQPGDSAPHDDHFHVRLACDPDEFARGCSGGGPRWPWLPLPKVVEAKTEVLVDALAAPIDEPPVRRP